MEIAMFWGVLGIAGRDRRHGVMGAFLMSTTALAGIIAAVPASMAQTANTQSGYDIPPQPLAQALMIFGRQSGMQVTAAGALTTGRTSTAVKGDLAAAEALSQLLTGTGLTFRFIDNGGIQIEAAPPSANGAFMLGTLRVEGNWETNSITSDPAATEGTGRYNADLTRSALGLALTPREVPQSVSVITRQRMDDQGVTSIADAVRTVAGVTVQNLDSDRLSFGTRGFYMDNIQQDGVSAAYDGVLDGGATLTDTAIYDRIEIVKGAAGLLSGAGDPGGVINMVRKRPTRTLQSSVTAMVGSWENYRGELDMGGPLTEDGTVRGRFVAAIQDRHSWMDYYKQTKNIFYGIGEVDLTPTTLVTLGVDYRSFTPRGSTWTGFPMMYSDGTPTDWDRSFNPATRWSRRDVKRHTIFGSVEQQLGEDWSLRLNVDSMRSRHDTVLGSASGGNPDPVTGEGMYYFIGKFAGDQTQNTVDAEVKGTVHLFGQEHQILAGYRWSRSDIDGPLHGSVYPAFEGSIFDWNGVYAEPDIPQVGYYKNGEQQEGLYLATHLNPTDDLHVVLGSRLTTHRVFTNNYYDDPATTNVNVSYKESNVWTPYAGIIYDLNKEISVYTSYTDIFKIQQNVDRNFDLLPPQKGKSYEAGVKGSWFDDALSASAALFQIEQTNLAVYRGLVQDIQVYDVVPGAKSKGIELEVSGTPLDGLNVYAGYTYSHIRDGDGELLYSVMLQTTQPAHVAKLHLTYHPQGALDRLTLGGGVDWQSKFFGNVWSPVPDVGYARFTQDAYALVDAFAEYQITDRVTARVNVHNLLNKKYYTGLGLFETGFYGEPRNVTLTVKASF
jgi:outer membrane receptor for ferric coprogen and ferric-rhodotorulic acid